MIKLPKKIAKTIERRLTSDYTVIKHIDMRSIFKEFNVHLIVLRQGRSELLTILRYFEDDSYTFLRGYTPDEVAEELAYQIKKLY